MIDDLENKTAIQNIKALRAHLIRKSLTTRVTPEIQASLAAFDATSIAALVQNDATHADLWEKFAILCTQTNRTFDDSQERKSLTLLIDSLKSLENAQAPSLEHTHALFTNLDIHTTQNPTVTPSEHQAPQAEALFNEQVIDPMVVTAGEERATEQPQPNLDEAVVTDSVAPIVPRLTLTDLPNIEPLQKILLEINNSAMIPAAAQSAVKVYVDYLKTVKLTNYYIYFNSIHETLDTNQVDKAAAFFIELCDLYVYLTYNQEHNITTSFKNDYPTFFIQQAKESLCAYINELAQTPRDSKKNRQELKNIIDALSSELLIIPSERFQYRTSDMEINNYDDAVGAITSIHEELFGAANINQLTPTATDILATAEAIVAPVTEVNTPISTPTLKHPYYLTGMINTPLREVPQYDEELTTELKASYIEEATTEIFPLIEACTEKLKVPPYAEDSVLELRRAFHTLKGSGFMAAFVEAGEIAWQIERVINDVRDKNFPFSEAILYHALDGYDAIKKLIINEPLTDHELDRIAYQANYLIENKGLIPLQFHLGDDVPPSPVKALDIANHTVNNAPNATVVPSNSVVTDLPSAFTPHPYYIQGFLAVPHRDVPAYDEELAAELKASFIEEATTELFPLVESTTQKLLTGAIEEETLLDLRRAFHTLKGSGFMAAFIEVGEIAWQVERVINEVRDQHIVFSEAIVYHALDGYHAINALLQDQMPPEHELERIAFQANHIISHKGVVEQNLYLLPADDPAPLIPHEATAELVEAPEPPLVTAETHTASVTNEEQLHQEEKTPKILEQLVTNTTSRSNPQHDDEDLMAGLKQEFQAEGSYSHESSFYQDFLADEELDNHGVIVDNNELISNLLEAFMLCKNKTHSALKTYARTVGTCFYHPLFSDDHPLNQILVTTYHRHLLLYRAHGLTPRDYTLEFWENILNIIINILEEKVVDKEEINEYVALLKEPIIALPNTTKIHEEVDENADNEVDEELYAAFVEEAHELLEQSDTLIQEWQQTNYDPNSRLVAELRRLMHTLKGGARMVGKIGVGELSHTIESLLDPTYIRSFNSDPKRFEVMQRAFDHILVMLELKSNKLDPEGYNLLSALHLLLGNETPAEIDIEGNIEGAETLTKITDETTSAAQAEFSALRITPTQLTDISENLAESTVLTNQQRRNIGFLLNGLTELERTIARINHQARRIEIETEAQIVSRHARVIESNDFDPLELDQFSELQHLSRSIMESVEDLASLHKNIFEAVDLITTNTDKQASTQSVVGKTLTDIGTVSFTSILPRLRRLVRQAGKNNNKKVEFVAVGAEIQVERMLLEQMIAPFEHMIRNAVIHGIEPPEERIKAGKPETGKITLKVMKHGAELSLQVIDDGRGFDTDKIRATALSSGLITQDQEIDDDALVNMVMLPGFTTAESVSQDAGRGVGLDVLAKALMILKAQAILHNQHGSGVNFEIRIPFTLSIINTLIISAGSKKFSIPLTNIIGVAQDKDAIKSEDKSTFIFHNESYEIYDLGKIYDEISIYSRSVEETTYLLFAAENQRIAIGINQIISQLEIVMRPLNPQIASIPGIVGSAVMPDGDIIYILDIPRLAESALIQEKLYKLHEHKTEVLSEYLDKEIKQSITPLVLVVDDSITMRRVSQRMLERVGLQVITAKDGLDAVEKLADHRPDVIMLDIEMPRMDGFEVLTYLKSEERLANIPVIMITSRTGEKHKQRAFDLGADEYCGKPYQEDEIIDIVSNLLADKWHKG